MNIASKKISIMWFKKDLRLYDNEALSSAAANGFTVGLFSLDNLRWNTSDLSTRHKVLLLKGLYELAKRLISYRVPVYLARGNFIDTLTGLKREFEEFTLYSHQETGNFSSYLLDKKVRKWCKSNHILWEEKRQNNVIRGLKQRDVWSRKWKEFMGKECLKIPVFQSNVCNPQIKNNQFLSPEVHDFEWNGLLKFCGLDHLALDSASKSLPDNLNETMQRLLTSFFQERSLNYRTEMSSPLKAEYSCSRLSPFLTSGMLSIRALYKELLSASEELKSKEFNATKFNSLRSFEKRLHWRCHFIQKLEFEPQLEFRCMHVNYEHVRNQNKLNAQEEEFLNLWKEGKTGFPLIDACMNYLKTTGWINFRMRAMLVSFASNNLWLHWTHSGEHLARLFLDYEPGIHWPQMQMQSGTTGINTIRIYNPEKQFVDQDPDQSFTKKWNPNGWPYSEFDKIVDLKKSSQAAREKLWAMRKSKKFVDLAKKVYLDHGSRKRKNFKQKRQLVSNSQLELLDKQ